MAQPLRIANAQGFWGDRPCAASRLLIQQGNLDYITLDYLSELSLSIMATQREKSAGNGYAKDFLDVVKELIPFWNEGSKVRLISNAGGLDPLSCGKKCAELLSHEKCSSIKIAIVHGDDVLETLRRDLSNPLYCNLESGELLSQITDRLTTANSYLGALPIVKALEQGADIVITGRVADPSLTVAPAIYSHGWGSDDFNLIAQATVAGHLIECGTQVTGGISSNWLSHREKGNIGFPFVEIYGDGRFIITKPERSGGVVDEYTVKEQLLYEIGDPSQYLSPDATVSFLSLQLTADGPNRIAISGAEGRAPPDHYKVNVTWRDGWKVEASVALFGSSVVEKAKESGKIILERCADAGFVLERTLIECIGNGDLVGGSAGENRNILECVLRIAVADQRKEACDRFSREVAALVTSGPQGVTGYATGRPRPRPLYGFWPCLIERSKVDPCVQIIN